MTAFCRLTCYLFILAINTCDKAFTQTIDIALQEKRLVALYSKLLNSFETSNDSVYYYSDSFGAEFKNLVRNNPITLNYSFKALIDSGYCDILTSSDSNFRVYSWDTRTGGTAHFFNQIYQYRSNGKVLTNIPEYEEGNHGSFFSKLYSVIIKNKTYYLTIYNGIYSSRDASQSISAFAITDDKLIDTIKLFKTKKQLLNSIDVEFDFLSVVDRPERPVELITYDARREIIYVPVVDDKGQVTKRNILYQLKDHYFEFMGIKTGMRK